MKIETPPVMNDISNNGKLTNPWFIWFRNISKNLIDSTKIVIASNYTYTINGNIMTIIYDGNGNESLSLPYVIACNQIFEFWTKDSNSNWVKSFIELNKNDNSIKIPGIAKINTQIIIEQRN